MYVCMYGSLPYRAVYGQVSGRTTGKAYWPVVWSIGVMQATGPPSRAPIYDRPFNCQPYLGVKTTGRTTVKRLARRKFECLPIAKSLYFYFCYYTISISRPRHREEGTGDRDTHAGTNVTKLPGQTQMNSHSRTPGQRVGRDTRWDINIVIAWPHTRRRISTTKTDSDRRQCRTSNDGRRPCRLSSSSTTTSQTTDEGCRLRCNDVATTMSRRRRGQNDVLVVITTWTS